MSSRLYLNYLRNNKLVDINVEQFSLLKRQFLYWAKSWLLINSTHWSYFCLQSNIVKVYFFSSMWWPFLCLMTVTMSPACDLFSRLTALSPFPRPVFLWPGFKASFHNHYLVLVSQVPSDTLKCDFQTCSIWTVPFYNASPIYLLIRPKGTPICIKALSYVHTKCIIMWTLCLFKYIPPHQGSHFLIL